jgi:O-Antigen ligase
VRGDAYGAGQTTLVYTGGLIAAAIALRGRWLRAVEPAVAGGTVIVIGYGLSERLVPGMLHFARSVTAQGRLEQPLTYWNAMGELAALGFVLCARTAGDATRPVALRAAAAAAVAPLGMGLYISFSRGALFACLAGLLALIAVAPRREQLVAVVSSVVVGMLAAIAAAPFHALTGLAGSLPTRERQGAIVLVLLVAIAVLGALAQHRLVSRGRIGPLRLPRRTPRVAVGVICAALALAIVVGAHESSGASVSLSGGATRLVSLRSNRYDYWSVALRAFATEPLRGVGAGGWSVYWLRWRSVNEFAQNAHSLELETLADLGIVGVALLLTFFAGIVGAAARALRSPVTASAAAGPVAALVVYLVHSPLDWDWQMPAVTLVAIILAGALLSISAEAGENAQSASAIRGASRRKTQTASTQTVT